MLQNQMTKAQLFSWGRAHHSLTFKGTIPGQIWFMNWRKKYQVTEANKANFGFYGQKSDFIFKFNNAQVRYYKNKVLLYSKCEFGGEKKIPLKLSRQFLLHTEILCQRPKPSVMFL